MPDQKIELWPDWKIVGELGSGSFGKVYEIHRQNGTYLEKSALKVIRIPSNPAELLHLRAEGLQKENTEAYLSRHVNEIRNEIGVMQQFVGYSNIVSYEDYRIIKHRDDVGWDILIRMELLTPLSAFMMTHTLTEEMVLQVGLDISQALRILHGAGVIHRDIKPQNIFINERGYFKLGDFGISRSMPDTGRAMSFKGTLSYMAPETFAMRGADARSDIYSLALVLYKCLNGGREPFLKTGSFGPGDIDDAQNRRLKGAPVPEPSRGSRALARVILKALEPDPARRYQTADQFLLALREVSGQKTGRTVEVSRLFKPTMPVRIQKGIPSTPVDRHYSLPVEGGTGEKRGLVNESQASQVGSDIRGKGQSGRIANGYNINKREYAKALPKKRGTARAAVLAICMAAVCFLAAMAGWMIWDARKKTEPLQTLSETTDPSVPSISRMKEGRSIFSEAVSPAVHAAYMEDDAGDVVVFEDSALERAVREALGIEDGIPVTIGDAVIVTTLELSGENRDSTEKIKSLTGLSAFSNLEKLNLSNNMIETIEELEWIPSLRTLDLSGNRISDISALQGLTSLGYLDLLENEISDIGPIINLDNISLLDISSNVISSIDGIGRMSALEVLLMDNNQISNLRPLKTLDRLQYLTVGDNEVEDISVVRHLKSLVLLYVYDNRITDISSITALENLEELAVTGNPIEDYSPLDRLPDSVKVYRDEDDN